MGEAMASLDRREATGGALLTAVGAAFAVYAGAKYSIGTVVSMGPGMIPVSLGVLLAIFGLIILAGAKRADGSHADIRSRCPRSFSPAYWRSRC